MSEEQLKVTPDNTDNESGIELKKSETKKEKKPYIMTPAREESLKRMREGKMKKLEEQRKEKELNPKKKFEPSSVKLKRYLKLQQELSENGVEIEMKEPIKIKPKVVTKEPVVQPEQNDMLVESSSEEEVIVKRKPKKNRVVVVESSSESESDSSLLSKKRALRRQDTPRQAYVDQRPYTIQFV